MQHAHSRAFDAGQRDLLEQIANGAPLPELLEAVVRFIERQADGMLCSILLVDHEHGCVRPGAAPHLPAEYTRALDGAPIGPKAGSCGAAAARAERVVVEDIATHPYWEGYRELALPHGLRACWSSPIFAPDRRVLGTFAMYYRVSRGPTDAEMAWVDVATHLAAIAIVRDGAEQALRRRERELRQSEERLRGVIEHTPNVGVQWYDRQGHLLFANRASQRMFGWAGLDVIGKTLDQLNFTPEETARFMKAVTEAADTGAPVGPMEFGFVHPDGRPGILLSTVFRIPSGDDQHYVCMDVDLTDYKRMQEEVAASERQRAFIYNSVTDVIFYLAVESDDVFRFVSVNPAFLQATGLSEREVIGATVDQIIPNPSRSLVLSKYREAITSRQPLSWEEVTPYPSGVRYGHVTVSPLFDDKGRCVNLVGTVHDVTALREAENERRKLETKFQHAQRVQALGTLASGIAHDFNNILAVMLSHTEIALGHATAHGGARDSLEEVRSAGRRATGLVKQILSFSRRHEPKREMLRLENVIEEALRLLRATLPSSLLVHTSYANGMPSVYADAVQVHQVVMNLCTNAGHATKNQEGSIELDLDAVTVGSDGDLGDAGVPNVAADLVPGRYARLRVTDHGSGMDDATIAHIFEPFFTTKTEGQGTGLGLWVVHGIVKNHDGVIRVDSQPGRGTTFSVYLPTKANKSAAN